MCERERDRKVERRGKCVFVCERERERKCVRVRERERESVCVFVWERKRAAEDFLREMPFCVRDDLCER